MIKKSIILKNRKNVIIREVEISDSSELLSYLKIVGGETDFLTLGLKD